MIDKKLERDNSESERKSILIEFFGTTPKLRILDFLLDNRIFDFSKKEIIEGIGMSKTTFYKYWNDIEKLGLVKETRKFGSAQLYKINEKNPIIRSLDEFEDKLINQSIKLLSEESEKELNND